jgi:MFS family permease
MATTRHRTGLSKEQTRATLASLSWNMALRSVFDTLAGGTTFVFVAFALSVGVPKEKMGLVISLVGFACVLQLAGFMLGGKVRDKKRFVITLAVAEPVILIAAVLLVPWLPPGWRVVSLGAAAFTAAAFLHITKPLAEDWVASTVPSGVAGRYVSRRAQLLTCFTLGSTLLAGVIGDKLDTLNSQSIGLLIAVGGLFGLFAVLPLRGVNLPSMSAEARASWRDVGQVARHKPFKRMMGAMLVMSLPFTIAVPYYHVVHLEELHMSKSAIAAMQICYMLVKLASYGMCGRLVDRLGARPAMATACGVYILFFVSYMFAPGMSAWLVVGGWIFIASIGDALWLPGAYASLYGSVPRSDVRTAFFAIYNLLLLGMYAVGALVAVWLASLFKGQAIAWGPLWLGPFQIFYLLCMVLMCLCTFGAWLLPARSRAPARPTAELRG